MTCPRVVKTVLRWPTETENGPAAASGVAIPGPISFGTRVLIDGVNETYRIPDNLFQTTFDFAFKRLPLIDSNRLRAISIASDSAIHSCDISPVGRDEAGRTRVSPGNPMIADFSGVDFCMVSIPVAIPMIDSSLGATQVAWDAISARFTGVANDVWSWPLRLELWYDMLPVRSHLRAPYHAAARVTNDAADSVSLYVCVDGRKQIAIDVIPNTATLTVGVDAVVGFQAFAQTSLGSNLVLIAPVAVAATSRLSVLPRITDDASQPYSIIEITLADPSANAGGHFVNVMAWDD